MLSSRQKKQAIIGLVYLLIFTAIGFLIYLGLKPEATCFDGIQNQEELGIDCGGPCPPCLPKVADPIITNQQLINEGNGLYEFVAKIKNQSQIYGNPKIDYQINFYNSSGQIIQSIPQTTFILPGEEKYIVKAAIKLNPQEKITQAKAKITHIDTWQKLNDALFPDLVVKDKKIKIIGQPTKYAEVSGTIISRAKVGYQRVSINIILIGNDGRIARVNQTEMRTLMPEQERGFSIFWSKPFINQNFRLIIEPTANPFNQNNILIKK